MRINSSDKISDFPILTVRKFLRSASGFLININFIKYFFKTNDYQKYETFLKALVENDLVRFEKKLDEIVFYTITDKGNTLAKATARKPILRSTAERLIKEFISRAIEVRNNHYYLFKVKRAIVFGSYLSSEERLSDVDIAVEIIPKEEDTEKHKILVEKRIREVQNKGRQFSSDLDAIFWPQIEVEQYLRSRSSSISLEYVEKDELEKIDHKIIYVDM